jgi:hypothetical protein
MTHPQPALSGPELSPNANSNDVESTLPADAVAAVVIVDDAPAPLITAAPTIPLERIDWPQAKVELLERAGEFVVAQGDTLAIACGDPRCAADPVLKRVDVPQGGGAFVLVCQHAMRVCIDRRDRKKNIKRSYRQRARKRRR